jgi:hypothetical protein
MESEDRQICNVLRCARCGQDHPQLVFKKFLRSVEADEVGDNPSWTHWAPCPTNGDPILMRVWTDEEIG